MLTVKEHFHLANSQTEDFMRSLITDVIHQEL